MVRLNKITTRTGDDGSTGLADGSRVSKDDPRIEAIGTVEEVSAQIGLGRTMLTRHGQPAEPVLRLAGLLSAVQQDLFDLGAVLATPPADERALAPIGSAHIEALEAATEALNADLEALTSFVLPGGHPAAAVLHIARTVCRRAERRCVGLPGVAGPGKQVLVYLNRLSDLLFVASRWINTRSGGEVLWTPGGGTAPKQDP